MRIRTKAEFCSKSIFKKYLKKFKIVKGLFCVIVMETNYCLHKEIYFTI